MAGRLCPPMPTGRLAGWLATLAVTAVAAVLRMWDLTRPRGRYFDETYYAKDSWGLLTHGYEINTTRCSGGGFVVHPPLGK